MWLGPANQLTVDAFTVSSTGHKSPNSTAIRFLGPSVTQSLFDALIVNGVAPYGPRRGTPQAGQRWYIDQLYQIVTQQ